MTGLSRVSARSGRFLSGPRMQSRGAERGLVPGGSSLGEHLRQGSVPQLVDVVTVDEQHRRANMPQVVLSLQDAHNQVDGNPGLKRRLIGRGRDDRAALDASVDSRAEVV